MPNYVRVEYSGFWDFPTGNYSGGSKGGTPKSGMFNPKYLIMDSIGTIEYSIDPGKISMPVSPDFSFSLKNKDPETGEQIYPFEFLSTLGRTMEYGGTSQEFGDLYIRISFPFLNDKPIAKGVVERFEYSPYDMEVTIHCTDFIGSIKGTSRQIFLNYDLGSCRCVGVNSNTNDVASEVTGRNITSVVNINDTNIDIQKLTLLVEDIHEEGLSAAENQDVGDAQIPLGDGGPYNYGGGILDQINSYVNDHIENILHGFESFEFINRMVFGNPQVTFTSTTGVFDLVGTNIFERYSAWRPTFIKIEDSTILTMFRGVFRIQAFGNRYGSDNDQFNLHGFSILEFRLEVIHMNNTVSRVVNNGQKYIVLSRGKFYKSGSSVGEAQIKEDDEVNVNLIDYRTPLEPIGSPAFGILADRSFANPPDVPLGGTDVYDSLFIGGILFEETSNEIKTTGFGGYFNSFKAFLYLIENRLIDDYIDGNSFPVFDTSGVVDNLYQYCFVSDIIHYGWGTDQIHNLLVNHAVQISAYLFSNEKGEIAFKSRDRSYEDLVEEAIEIFPEDYEIVGGNKYDYGSKYYSVTYQDLVELNNVEGSDEVEIVVNSKGEVASTVVKPEDLQVANYRTSDLGVPSGSESGVRLRLSPSTSDAINFDYFINHPVDQGSIVARTIAYPSRLSRIRLDIRYGESKGYYEIGIGSYLIENTDEGLEIYLVKSIGYNVSNIFKNATSLELELFKITAYPTISEVFEEAIGIVEDQSDDVLENVEDLFSDTLNLQDQESSQIHDPVEDLFSDTFNITDNEQDEVVDVQRDIYSDSFSINDSRSESADPEIPTAPTITGHTVFNNTTSFEITINPPSNGNPDWYEVWVRVNGGSWILRSDDTFTGGATSHLTNGQEGAYWDFGDTVEIRIRGYNLSGSVKILGEWSNVETVQISDAPPVPDIGPPSLVSVSNLGGSTSVRVRWNHPDEGRPDSYIIEHNRNGIGWATAATPSSSSTSYDTAPFYQPGDTVSFRMRSVVNSMQSDPSNVLSLTIDFG